MKTYMANPDKIERKWYVVDASEYTLGRLASEVAKVLRGKNKPEFTPHVDTGDYVIVVNAEKIKVTGKKLDQKIYYLFYERRWYNERNNHIYCFNANWCIYRNCYNVLFPNQ